MTANNHGHITIIANGEDWEAVYLDGVKLDDGHKIRWAEVLGKLGYSVTERWVSAEDENAFPENLYTTHDRR